MFLTHFRELLGTGIPAVLNIFDTIMEKGSDCDGASTAILRLLITP